jgi:hypothetical protein
MLGDHCMAVIRSVLTNVFLQSVSWYIGLVQVAAALLTVAIYIMVFMRKRSKKNLKQQMRLSGYEQSRH